MGRWAAAAIVLALGSVHADEARATTWFPQEATCPVCGDTLEVQAVGSYGSYIYRWPSRYQMIFWPHTDPQSLYFCGGCHTAAFLGDFKEIPAERAAAIREAVAPLRKEQPDVAYARVPMAYRLAVAEAVYRQLGKDDEFWCRFHRIRGYHLARAGDEEGARSERLAAARLAHEAIAAMGSPTVPKWAGEGPSVVAKEMLVIAGSMELHAGQTEAARGTLERAIATPIPPGGRVTAEVAARMTDYLDEVAQALLEGIRAGTIPGE